MQKYVLAALLATAVVGGKIPLSKRPLSKATINYMKEQLATGQNNGLGGHLPLKDYMNT